MNIRPVIFDQDFPTVQGWWRARGSSVLPAPAFMSAEGFIVESGGIPVAVSWLYVVPGTKGGIGVVEFTTTNPAVAVSRDLISCVRALYAHVQTQAWAWGCGSVMSFVAPDSAEQRIFEQDGWKDLTGGVPHLMYGKERPPCL